MPGGDALFGGWFAGVGDGPGRGHADPVPSSSSGRTPISQRGGHADLGTGRASGSARGHADLGGEDVEECIDVHITRAVKTNRSVVVFNRKITVDDQMFAEDDRAITAFPVRRESASPPKASLVSPPRARGGSSPSKGLVLLERQALEVGVEKAIEGTLFGFGGLPILTNFQVACPRGEGGGGEAQRRQSGGGGRRNMRLDQDEDEDDDIVVMLRERVTMLSSEIGRLQGTP